MNDGDSDALEFDKDVIEFEEYFGGKIYLIENYNELEAISTTEESESDPTLWATILEKADAFDDCSYICDGKYAILYNATTDSGGSTYLVPRKIADLCGNIKESVEKTRIAWG